jgi:hypothetical protein
MSVNIHSAPKAKNRTVPKTRRTHGLKQHLGLGNRRHGMKEVVI